MQHIIFIPYYLQSNNKMLWAHAPELYSQEGNSMISLFSNTLGIAVEHPAMPRYIFKSR